MSISYSLYVTGTSFDIVLKGHLRTQFILPDKSHFDEVKRLEPEKPDGG